MATEKTDDKGVEKHLQSTAEMIDEHVKSESLTGISNSISSWIKTLSEHKEFKEMSGDLEKLKTAISDKDGKQIVSLMTKLGAETTKAASGAETGDTDKIKLLGKALTNGAKALSKLV